MKTILQISNSQNESATLPLCYLPLPLVPAIIGEDWMGVPMFGLLLLGLISGILAIGILSVDEFDGSVSLSLPGDQPISWSE
jgi:hypothetical protein